MKHKSTEADATPESNICGGYLRQPHLAPIALEFQHPDGHTTALCRLCANRWLLSEEEFPPQTDTRRKDTSRHF